MWETYTKKFEKTENDADVQSLLSVIVPVYNVEKNNKRCIESVLAQSYATLEIIFVTNESEKDEEKTIQEYAMEDIRIKILRHEENAGLFQARLTGVKASTGKYVAFMDCHDYISVDYYRVLMKKALETDSDITVADWAFAYEDGKLEYASLDQIRLQDLYLEGKEVFGAFMKQEGNCSSWHMICNKIYTKRLWEKCLPRLTDSTLTIGRLSMAEDLAFSATLWSFAKKVSNVHGVYYFYSIQENRSTNTDTPEKFRTELTDVGNVLRYFEGILRETGTYLQYQKNLVNWGKRLCRQYYDTLMKRLPVNNYKKRRMREWMRSIFEVSADFSSWKNKRDDFTRNTRSSLTPSFAWMEDIKRAIIDPTKEIISFDIFDTLITRPFFYPTDLFYLLDKEFLSLTNAASWLSFHEMRIEAEKNCRDAKRLSCPSTEDITLENIYSQMADDYIISREVLEHLKEEEIVLELRFCRQRFIGRELYELAVHCNKRVIYTSDMYLPGDIIKKILCKNGYSEGNTLYLSSEVGLCKTTGNLYKYVLKKEKISPKNIVHIGDNRQSDVDQPRLQGICACHLSKPIDLLRGANQGIYSGRSFEGIFYSNLNSIGLKYSLNTFLGLRCALALVANKIFDSPATGFNEESDFNADPRYIGYYALGMHCLALTDWLLKNIDRANCATVHFVARDGYLLQQIYDILTKDIPNAPKSNYLYLSRKALLAADIFKKIDLYSLHKKLNILKLTPDNMFYYFSHAIQKDKLEGTESWIASKGFKHDTAFANRKEFDAFLKFFADECLDETLLKDKSAAIYQFVRDEIRPGDVLFDIGYSGRAEAALSKILKFSVNSMYVHSNNSDVFDRANFSGFENRQFYNYKPVITGFLREHLMMKPSPSVIVYQSTDDGTACVFEDYEDDYSRNFVTYVIQKSAVAFIDDYKTIFSGYCDQLYFRWIDMSQPFEYFLHFPCVFDQRMFENLKFEDDLVAGTIDLVDAWNEELGFAGSTKAASLIDLEDLYSDGLFVKLFRRVNKVLPIGSRRRELVKKLISLFFK